MRVIIDAVGADGTARSIEAIGERTQNLRNPLQQIARGLLSSQRSQFATGKGWRQLAASTRERKARQGLDPRRMVATGALERALTSRSAARVTRTELRYGTTVFYARFHVKGGGRLPRRRPVFVRAADRREWRQQITDHILGPFR